ncbi:MAG TPA: hypothetical protein VEH04_07405 [Verrucomicrobiae bacterium]|nr:hypothetical protein [Verrucomicrobiae bacterium]
MKTRIIFGFLAALLFCGSAGASLTVTVAEPKLSGGSSVIKLTMHNTFGKAVESARAVVFLKEAGGKVVHQKTQWVIGGTRERPPLQVDKKVEFFITVPADTLFEKTDIVFTRIILAGGEVIPAGKGFQIVKPGK